MSRHASLLLALVAIGAVIVAGVLALRQDGTTAAPAADILPEAPTAQAEAAVAAEAPPRRRRRIAIPVRVQIPSIGVDAHVIKLGLDRTGALEVPQNYSETGWWSGGARPGQAGPAVIVGHVDSKTGPAVFYRLRRLHRGDAIVVTRKDGRRVRFTVQRSEHYAKDRFPSKAVYGPTGRPALRLITCSGTFDRSTGHYIDNTVVYAS